MDNNGSELAELVVDLHLHNDKRRPEAVFKKRIRLFYVNFAGRSRACWIDKKACYFANRSDDS